jgi:hypothetical protein
VAGGGYPFFVYVTASKEVEHAGNTSAFAQEQGGAKGASSSCDGRA